MTDIFKHLLADDATEEEIKEQTSILEDEAAAFGLTDEDSQGIDIKTSVSQGDSNKVQNVDEINKKNQASVEDEDLFDLGDLEKDAEETEAGATGEDGKKPVGDNVYSALVSELSDKGLFGEVDEEELSKIEDADSLLKLVETSISKKEYADLNDTQKEYLDGLRVGVPSKVIEEHQYIESQLNSIKEEEIDEQLAAQILATQLKNTGLSEQRVQKMIELAHKDGSIIDEGKASLEILKTAQAEKYQAEVTRAKLENENLLKEEEKTQEELKKYLTSESQEVLPGIKINKKEGEAIFSQMITPVAKTKSGKVINAVEKYAIENPIEYKAVLNYLFFNGFFDKKADIKSLTKGITTKTVNRLDSILRGSSKTLSGGAAKTMGNDDDMIDTLLDSL